jgi:hypothetical protein
METATAEPSFSSFKRTPSAPGSNILLQLRVTEFVKTHLVFEAGHFISTKLAQDTFIDVYKIDAASLSASGFQRMLNGCVRAKFPDQSSVFASRTTPASGRCRGYIGLKIASIHGGSQVQFASVSGKPNIKNSGIYVLRLDNKPTPSFYVGKAIDIVHRIQQHTDGEGAYCITGEPFTRIEPLTKGSVDDMESWERNEVLTRMHEFGIDNVRGWMYTLKTMPMEQKMHAFDEICEKFDFCRKCGRNSHFIRDCHSMSTDLWTGGMELRIRGSGQAAAQQSALDDASRRIAEAQEMIASAARVLGGGV